MADRDSRRKQIALKRREQILKAALDVFAQKGYTAATLPEIAKSAGIVPGTIYVYYTNKRELFIAVIENLIFTPLVGVFERESQNTFPATMNESLQKRLQILQSDLLTKIIALIGEIQRDPELRTLFLTKVLQPFLARMEEINRSRIESSELRRMDPAIIARLIGSVMIGITLLKGLEGESSPLNHLSQEQLADEITKFIMHGLMGGKGEIY